VPRRAQIQLFLVSFGLYFGRLICGRKKTNIKIKYKNNAKMDLVMQNNNKILQTNSKKDFVTNN
jgi:hypothetical protein